MSLISCLPICTKAANAVTDPRWKAAVIEEMSVPEKYGTRDLVALLEGNHAIGYECTCEMGLLSNTKLSWWLKGFTQRCSVD